MGWFRTSLGQFPHTPQFSGVGSFPHPKAIVDWVGGKELVQTIQIPEGEAGTEATIQVMTKLALDGAQDPRMVTLAQSIANGTGSKDYRAELEKIFDYVKRTTRYRRDPLGLEWVQTPYYTMFVRGESDCDDSSVLLATLSLCLGNGAAFKSIKGDPSRPQEFSHVYALLGYTDRTSPDGVTWLPADATQGVSTPLGWEPPPEKTFGSKTWVIARP